MPLSQEQCSEGYVIASVTAVEKNLVHAALQLLCIPGQELAGISCIMQESV